MNKYRDNDLLQLEQDRENNSKLKDIDNKINDLKSIKYDKIDNTQISNLINEAKNESKLLNNFKHEELDNLLKENNIIQLFDVHLMNE